MTTKPTGLDQSWGYADPKTAAQAGVQVVSMYLSWDGSKNVTAKDVKAYHKAGIGMMLNWESQQGAPLAGEAQARSDATEAVRQAKQLVKDVGYAPTGPLVIYFSCDRDVNAGQLGPVFSYYKEARRICHAAAFGVGAYGEASLVSALAKANITDAEWQTYAWSNGVLSPDADFYQYLNGQQLGGASVDLDRIIHRDQLGAWWPPNAKSTAAGSLTVDQFATLQKQLAALDKKIDALPTQLLTTDVKIWNGTTPNLATLLSTLHKYTHDHRDALSTVQKTIAEKVASFDAPAAAVQLRDRFLALIGGHQ